MDVAKAPAMEADQDGVDATTSSSALSFVSELPSDQSVRNLKEPNGVDATTSSSALSFVSELPSDQSVRNLKEPNAVGLCTHTGGVQYGNTLPFVSEVPTDRVKLEAGCQLRTHTGGVQYGNKFGEFRLAEKNLFSMLGINGTGLAALDSVEELLSGGGFRPASQSAITSSSEMPMVLLERRSQNVANFPTLDAMHDGVDVTNSSTAIILLTFTTLSTTCTSLDDGSADSLPRVQWSHEHTVISGNMSGVAHSDAPAYANGERSVTAPDDARSDLSFTALENAHGQWPRTLYDEAHIYMLNFLFNKIQHRDI